MKEKCNNCIIGFYLDEESYLVYENDECRKRTSMEAYEICDTKFIFCPKCGRKITLGKERNIMIDRPNYPKEEPPGFLSSGRYLFELYYKIRILL